MTTEQIDKLVEHMVMADQVRFTVAEFKDLIRQLWPDVSAATVERIKAKAIEDPRLKVQHISKYKWYVSYRGIA